MFVFLAIPVLVEPRRGALSEAGGPPESGNTSTITIAWVNRNRIMILSDEIGVSRYRMVRIFFEKSRLLPCKRDRSPVQPGAPPMSLSEGQSPK